MVTSLVAFVYILRILLTAWPAIEASSLNRLIAFGYSLLVQQVYIKERHNLPRFADSRSSRWSDGLCKFDLMDGTVLLQ